MKAVLLLVIAVSSAMALGHENFVHGVMPSVAVSAHAPASDNHLWATLLEEHADADTEGASESLTGAEETFEDVADPTRLLAAADAEEDAEDTEAEEQEDSYALVEVATDAEGFGEAVTFDAADNEVEAEAEEMTASSTTIPLATEQAVESAADQIMANLNAETERAAEPLHAWDAAAEGLLADSEAEEMADADVVAEAQHVAEGTAFLEIVEAEAEAEEDEEEAEEEDEEESEDEDEAEEEADEEVDAEATMIEVDALHNEIDADVETMFVQLAEIEAETETESDDEVADDMSESPAFVEVDEEEEEAEEEESEEEADEESEDEEEADDEDQTEEEAEEEDVAEEEGEAEESADDMAVSPSALLEQVEAQATPTPDI